MRTKSFQLAFALILMVGGGGNSYAQKNSPGENKAPRPNIIVIMADDMGFSDIGCYGGEIKTPNLDRLARKGLRFTQFYNTARCCPTRASLLTGLYPHQAGVGHMLSETKYPGYSVGLNKNCLTFAEVLKPAGYKAYAVGKWHVTKFIRPEQPKDNYPTHRGFDKFYGMISGAGSFFDPHSLVRGDQHISAYADPEYKPKQYYFTEAISDHAVRFLGEHHQEAAEKPFFMYVAYTAAHWPMHALPEDIAKYKGVYDKGYDVIRAARLKKASGLGLVSPDQLSKQAGNWKTVQDKEFEIACMQVYAAMVDRMDQGIGKIIKQLEAQNCLDNTIIFYLQDNGGCAEGMGRAARIKKRPHGPRLDRPTLPAMKNTDLQLAMIPEKTRDGYPVRQGQGVIPGPADTYIGYGQAWANVSNTPFREYKHWVHEGGISTPLIVHWPRGIKAQNELRSQPGHLIDIMATVVDLSGARYPESVGKHKITPLAGVSLVPAFSDKKLPREALYWEHEGNRAIRVGSWKAVAKGPQGAWELYDLSRDRIEAVNLAQQQPDKLRTMVKMWGKWATNSQVLPWIWEKPYQYWDDTKQ